MKVRYLPHEELVDILGRLINGRRIQFKSGTDAYHGSDGGTEMVVVTTPFDGSALAITDTPGTDRRATAPTITAPIPDFDALHLVDRSVCEQTIGEMDVRYGVDLGNGATMVYGTRYGQPAWCVLMPAGALSIVWWGDQ